jgi:hypothetical protein
MRSGQKRVSKRNQLLAAVLLSLLGVAARSQAQGPVSTVIPSPDSDESSFGETVSLSADGQTALVGGDAGSHRAYVFVHGSGGWSLDTRLPAAGPARDGDAFGWVVALSGDGKVALVAAPLTFASCPNDFPFPCGEVYVYVREGGAWTLKSPLKPPTAVDFEFNFGSAIALSGDGSTVLVGRPADDCVHQLCRGVVFVYERTGDSWTLVDSLRASNPSVQKFGSSISLSPDGGTALIGAPHSRCDNGSICGEAYVFTKGGGAWSEQARLTAFDGSSQGFFGSSAAISADGLTALVGAPANDFAPEGPGSIYAFVRSGNSWVGAQKITGALGEGFGDSLSLAADGRSALLGAPFRDCAAGADCGAVYQMKRGAGGLWSPPQLLASFPAGAQGGFSVALSADGSVGLAGAPGASCTTGPTCGAAYVLSGFLTTIDVPTLGGAGLAVLTLALIAAALLFLRRRRSI